MPDGRFLMVSLMVYFSYFAYSVGLPRFIVPICFGAVFMTPRHTWISTRGTSFGNQIRYNLYAACHMRKFLGNRDDNEFCYKVVTSQKGIKYWLSERGMF